jgi:dienelactone hydrolase
MKTKLLATALTISVILNILAIVFISCYLPAQHKRYKALKRERNQYAQSLSAVKAATVANEGLESGRFIKQSFVSQADGQEDQYALMQPRVGGAQADTLVVYLHGMGSNMLEPFVTPAGEQVIAQAISNKYPNAVLLSCSYRREASWGSDLAMADISQNIRDILQQFSIKRIVLMGTSMGGCTVLTYATSAPADIKDKISGIVSVEGAGSLNELFTATNNAHVRFALVLAMGGTYKQVPAAYEHKSFLPNIGSLPANVRVAVVSANHDRVVPPHLQQQIVTALEQRNIPTKLISIDASHGAPPARIYLQGLDFALGEG